MSETKNALAELTAEQRADALTKATETRQQRAEISRQLTEGEMTLTRLFSIVANEPDSVARKMKVSTVLRALPGIGGKRAESLMGEAGIASNRRLGGVGSRQRHALMGLADRAAAR